MTKHTTYLLLGSNIHSRTGYLAGARKQIGRLIGEIQKISVVYESEPWGFDAAVPFLNQVVCVETDLSPEQLLGQTREIERMFGRKQKSKGGKYSSRTLDVDILFYDDAVIYQPDLTLPHPRIAERRFTLIPLAEVAPDFMHPVLNQTVAHLLKECPDKGKVWKFEEKPFHAI